MPVLASLFHNLWFKISHKTLCRIIAIYVGVQFLLGNHVYDPPADSFKTYRTTGWVLLPDELFLWQARRLGSHCQSIWETRTSAETVLENSWRRFCLQRRLLAHYRFHDYALYNFILNYITYAETLVSCYLVSITDIWDNLLDKVFRPAIWTGAGTCWVGLIQWQTLWNAVYCCRTGKHNVMYSEFRHHLTSCIHSTHWLTHYTLIV